MSNYDPKPEHKFTFGLWTVGNIGRDPFGEPTRKTLSPVEIVHMLAEVGAWGVNFHDNDLVPTAATASEREQIIKDFKQALDETGIVVPMATTNLFSHPVFKDGAFTSNDPRVRGYALQKTMNAIDLGVELGATTYVFWGGREGTESDSSKNTLDALKWFRESLNFLTEYVKDNGYNLKFALEPKPNEPRSHIFLPTVGDALGFINTLDHPEMVGLNPEVAHETMAGLNFLHGVAMAYDAGKLFHIDLNDQLIGRYDQDFRFASVGIKQAFYLVKFLEDVGYDGSRHFDAHAFRSSNYEDVKHFARGCMRSYLILKEKAEQFNQDEEIQALLAEITSGDNSLNYLSSGYSTETAKQLRETDFDRDALGARNLPYEQLDQLTIELLLGVR